MRGSIRFFVGFLVVFGAVGALDADPNASLLVSAALAAAGLLAMYSGTRAMQQR